MGQIFGASAYDIETKTCCLVYADKLHANCYAHSCAVLSMHYLLRQKPYHIMWGGDYITIEDSLENFSEIEQLLGISTYMDYESFELNNQDLDKKRYFDKAKFIGENHNLWTHIDISDDAEKYFYQDKLSIVNYSGYLINHTKKLAIDLVEYNKNSKVFINRTSTSIDLIPVLTETGGGSEMVFMNGISIDTTEELAGQWCGDFLQIVDELPEDYKLINCCFANARNRMIYCYEKFGIDKDGFILKDEEGNKYGAAVLNLIGERQIQCYIKAEKKDKSVAFSPVNID